MSLRIARLAFSKACIHLLFLMNVCCRLSFAIAFLSFLSWHSAFSLENENTKFDNSTLKEITVTAIQPFSLADLPRNISIITADDIAKSAATNLPELLARKANIVVSSVSGNEKFSSIDIRGSGDTSSSNILTIIDGAKINNPDLSGADFSIISLSQIEKIEIVRGANTVRYGSGASHGVINITTKKPEQHFASNTNVEHGSFNRYAIENITSLQLEKHGLAISPSFRRSDGYREHNKLLTRDFLIAYRAEFDPSFILTAKVRLHEDDYQLPGQLTRNALQNGVSRRSSNPDTRFSGSTEDHSEFIQFRAAPLQTLRLQTNLQHRERRNTFFDASMGNADRIVINSESADLLMSWSPNHLPLKLDIGNEYQNTGYSRTNGGINATDRILIKGDVSSIASFAYLEVNLDTQLRLNLGYRQDRSKLQFSESQLSEDNSSADCSIVNDPIFGPIPINCPVVEQSRQQQSDHWNNEAFEIGAVWSPKSQLKALSIYSSVAKTFRNPNVDELALTPRTSNPNEPPLIPQSAERIELGLNLTAYKTELSLGGFYFRTEDEIIFRPLGSSSSVNINFPHPIYRRGIELEISSILTPSLGININFGYTKARTRNNQRIPLSPDFTASSNINWSMSKNTHLYFATRHNSSRLDGNDLNSTQFQRLKSHTLSDIKISFSPKANKQSTDSDNRWNFSFGINNVFNEQYFLLAYSDTVYPAAERHYYGGIRFEI